MKKEVGERVRDLRGAYQGFHENDGGRSYWI